MKRFLLCLESRWLRIFIRCERRPFYKAREKETENRPLILIWWNSQLQVDGTQQVPCTNNTHIVHNFALFRLALYRHINNNYILVDNMHLLFARKVADLQSFHSFNILRDELNRSIYWKTSTAAVRGGEPGWGGGGGREKNESQTCLRLRWMKQRNSWDDENWAETAINIIIECSRCRVYAMSVYDDHALKNWSVL